MTNEANNTETFSVIPKGQEERDYFASQVNKLVDLKFQLDALKDTQKSIMLDLFEKANLDVKKGKYNKRLTNIVKEHLESRLSVESVEAEQTVDDYSLISAKLR